MDRFVCLDVEMPNGDGNRISAVGVVVFEHGEVTLRRYALINPETWFQPYVVGLIGITPEMVQDAPTFSAYWPELEPILSDSVIVAHGAGNDLKALSCCLRHYGIQWQEQTQYLCTVEACTAVYPDRGAYGLDVLCEAFSIPLMHHNALSDAEACGRLLLQCVEDGLDETAFIKAFDLLHGHGANQKKKRTRRKKTAVHRAQTEIRADLQQLATAHQRHTAAERLGMPEEALLGVSRDKLYLYEKESRGSDRLTLFLQALPHDYHEENNLHAIALSHRSRFSMTVKGIEAFLPFVDNEETCALIRPKLFRKKQPELGRELRRWLRSDDKFTVLFALYTLKNFYIKTPQLPVFLDMVASLETDDAQLLQAREQFFERALLLCPAKTADYLSTHDLGDLGAHVAQSALQQGTFSKEQTRQLQKLVHYITI